MLIKRVSYERILAFAVVTWICTFTIIGYRILGAIDRDGEKGRVKQVLDLAGKAFIPLPRDDHPYAERLKVQQHMREMKKILQVAPPDDQLVKNERSPGEMGAPINIDVNKLSSDEKAKYDKGWADNAFNEYASSMMSLERTLPDFRDKECKVIEYDEDLPTVSVIIIFHNEAWSVLLRTVHSVINRSDKRYLKEVILVDDASDREYLKENLEKYVDKLGIVRVIRMDERSGLIKARIRGSDEATAEALIFLDSHCEATTGWLEPLLDILKKNPNASSIPIIETISDTTFAINGATIEGLQVGGFNWDLIYSWHAIPKHELERRKKRTDPVRSPAMAGGLFAIRKDWFEKLGKYDPQMEIWGGENIELSLKLWMCGGELLVSPCSHVGHVFRKRSPYKWPRNKNVVLYNTMRVALVWLDEFLPYYMNNIPTEKRDPSLYGDVSSRLKLRHDLKCKNFSYFYNEIYPEMFVPNATIHQGEVRNGKENVCLDSHATKTNDDVIAYPCHGQRGPQLWYYTKLKEVRKETYCLDYAGGGQSVDVPDLIKVYPCHGSRGNQYWDYTDDKLLRHSSGLCLAFSEGQKLTMTHCNKDDVAQRWYWSKPEK